MAGASHPVTVLWVLGCFNVLTFLAWQGKTAWLSGLMRESLNVVPAKVWSFGPERNWTASAGDSDQNWMCGVTAGERQRMATRDLQLLHCCIFPLR